MMFVLLMRKAQHKVTLNIAKLIKIHTKNYYPVMQAVSKKQNGC